MRGQAGSLLLWVLMLGAMGAATVATNRNKNRALMPVATVVISTVTLFFMVHRWTSLTKRPKQTKIRVNSF